VRIRFTFHWGPLLLRRVFLKTKKEALVISYLSLLGNNALKEICPIRGDIVEKLPANQIRNYAYSIHTSC